ncbi:MAG TPA: acyltransferase [Verrucomicrobiae bacterium]|nr:acyltransferase [Verrucomicrobiae bacterium]
MKLACESETGQRTTFSGADSLALAPPGQLVSHKDLARPRSPRYETLTAWRGIACLFVVIFHSVCTGYGLSFPDGPGPLGWVLAVVHRLWIGVPLFFVISGYCVTASADAARQRPSSGANFFRRRFRRIYPPYWAWLLITAAGVWFVESKHAGFFQNAFVPNPRGFTKWQWFGNLTLTESWRWHITRGVENELLSPSWTLCYEEQFYALVGLALLLARRFFFGALALLTLAVFAGLFVLPPLGVGTLGLFLDGQWLMFAAGAVVYYALNYAPARAMGWFCVPLGFGVLCAVAGPEHLLIARTNEPNQSYLCAFLFALALLGLRRWDTQLARARLVRPLLFCGEMCYSLYLIHWPVVTVVSWGFNRLGLRNPFAIFFLGVSCCLAVALGLGRLFYRLIERRFWNPGYSTIGRTAE